MVYWRNTSYFIPLYPELPGDSNILYFGFLLFFTVTVSLLQVMGNHFWNQNRLLFLFPTGFDNYFRNLVTGEAPYALAGMSFINVPSCSAIWLRPVRYLGHLLL